MDQESVYGEGAKVEKRKKLDSHQSSRVEIGEAEAVLNDRETSRETKEEQCKPVARNEKLKHADEKERGLNDDF